ncbi:DUF5946 family protein [Chitinophaga sp. 212800010-3]|uniref:DUF5946 family protein n=1 Tax=unclassified Chitinophaga TaxID=2619133 RepID=UPI002DF3EBD3|nr:APG6 domain-containing protein [Chitinophaga sp. 212800010-3]
MSDNKIICPGCKLHLPEQQLAPSERYNASGECQELFNELSGRTFSFRDPDFHHQLAVDAYGAQHSGGISRGITTAYALIGLYLTLECGYTGKQVQHIHSIIAKQSWTAPALPVQAGTVTVQEVLKATTEDGLYAAMKKWGQSVWDSWAAHHAWVKEQAAPYIK